MEIKNPVSQNIRIKNLKYRNVDLRRGLINSLTQNTKKYVHLFTQYLVGVPLAQITASMRRDREAMWHYWGVMEAQVALIAAYSSSVLLGLVDLIFLVSRWKHEVL